MAYMNQERKKVIASRVNPILKKYGIKGTLSVRNHSTIVLSIKSGKINFVDNYLENAKFKRHYESDDVAEARKEQLKKEKYIGVNPYWYEEQFSGVAKEFLEEVICALKSADWFDDSDIQSDYFHTAYYYDVDIGKWNKPYDLIQE